MNQNEQRRRHILDSGAKLIIHYGYDKTTVSDIAKSAGISKGAIYLHFAGKEELFGALLWREIARYMIDWLEKIEADPQGGTLGAMFKHSLTVLNDNAFMMALLRQDQHVLGSYLDSEQNNLWSTGRMMDKQFIELLKTYGVVRQDVDSDIFSYILYIISQGMLVADKRISPEETPDIEKVIEGIYVMVERTLEPPGGGNSEQGKNAIRQYVEFLRQQLPQLERDPT